MMAIVTGLAYPDPEIRHTPGIAWDPTPPQTLILGLPTPSAEEIAALQGELAFAYAAPLGVPTLLINPEASPGWWLQVSWIPMDDESVEQIMSSPAQEENEHSTFSMVVIDSATGIVAQQRLATWSPHFSQAVNTGLKKMAIRGVPHDPGAILDTLSAFDTATILAQAVVRTRAGQ